MFLLIKTQAGGVAVPSVLVAVVVGKKGSFALQLYPVFLGRHAEACLHELAEERHVGEPEHVGDFLYRNL